MCEIPPSIERLPNLGLYCGMRLNTSSRRLLVSWIIVP